MSQSSSDVSRKAGMAILKVARLGHPVLRKVAEIVPHSEITRPETQRLIDDMIETMHEYIGVGLAGPQVHVSRQIAVLECESHPRYPEMASIPLMVIINPVLTPVSDETATDYCVRASTLDALSGGFEVVVLTDAIGAVDLEPGDGARAIGEMRDAGAKFATMNELGI